MGYEIAKPQLDKSVFQHLRRKKLTIPIFWENKSLMERLGRITKTKKSEIINMNSLYPESYQKIKVSIHLQPEDCNANDLKVLEWLENQQIVFVDEFYQQIVNAIGESGWSMRFIYRVKFPDQLVVDIHVDDHEKYLSIIGIIKKNKQFNYTPYRKRFLDF